MNFDRIFSVLALIAAVAALLFSIGVGQRNPLGSDISKYDLSSPQAALLSIQEMIKTNDILAGIQYTKNFILMMSNDESGFNLFFDNASNVALEKTFIVTGSGDASENGKVVSFVTYEVKGVEFREVFYFNKLDDGTFYLTDKFTPPYWEKEQTEADKRYVDMIKNFRDTGAVN